MNLETVAKDIVSTPDHAALMEATISDPALDMMIADATDVMKHMDRKGKFAFLLFVLGSADEVLDEIQSVPFLQVVT